MHASHPNSAMRLGEKAAPPRTPEQLAELGKYSGRSSPSWVNIQVAASKLGKYSDPDAQVAVCPGKVALGANPEALGKMLTSIPPGAPGACNGAHASHDETYRGCESAARSQRMERRRVQRRLSYTRVSSDRM